MADTEKSSSETSTSHKRKMSAGELLFDRVVYTGIGLGVNEVSSLWITDQFMNGKNLFGSLPSFFKTIGAWFSKEGFDRASEFIARTFKMTSKVAKDGKEISAAARGGNTLLMVTLLSGGTLLILPMKWLEDHKIQMVEKFNHLIDRIRGRHMTAEQLAARDDQVKKDIACSPRQSWGSMLVGRVIAMCSSVGTGTLIVGKEGNDKLMNWAEKKFTSSNQPEGQWNTLHRYVRLGVIETYSCTIASIVLEVFSKLTAKRSSKPHDPVLCEALSTPPQSQPKAEDNKDCGCNSSKNDGFHAAKVQMQKTQAASSLQEMRA